MADNSTPSLPGMVIFFSSKNTIDVLAMLMKTDTDTNEYIRGCVSYPRPHQGRALALSAHLQWPTKHFNVPQRRLSEI